MEALIQDGWSIKPQAWEELQAEATADVPLTKLLLNSDLCKVGKASLPDDVNRAESKQLKGPHILQVSTAEDVSTPSKGALNTSKQRLLSLKLTDGKVSAKAMEFKTLALPKAELLPPGTKVLISNASVKAGVILLEDKCFKILGGHVEHLVEGWDFQRRFAGNKAEPMAAEDQARAPRFSHFVPGKTRAPSQYVHPSADAQHPPKAAASASPGPPPGFPAQPASATSGLTKEAVNGNQQNGTRIQSEGQPAQQVARKAPEVQEDVGATLGQARAQGAAKAKLMERLVDSNQGGGRFGGRGPRGGRRRGGRGRYDDEDDSSMTLAEWEARHKGSKLQMTDEELARQLQESLDVEDQEQYQQESRSAAPSLSAAEELRQSMFSFVPPADAGDSRGRGRGREGRRGRGRRGRH